MTVAVTVDIKICLKLNSYVGVQCQGTSKLHAIGPCRERFPNPDNSVHFANEPGGFSSPPSTTTQRPAYTPASSSVTSAACCLLDFLFQPTPITFPSSSYLATHPGARIVGTRTVTGSDSEAGRLPAHPHNSSRLTLHTRSRSLSGLPLKKPPACIQAYIFLMFLSLIQLHKSSHQTSNRWRYIWS